MTGAFAARVAAMVFGAAWARVAASSDAATSYRQVFMGRLLWGSVANGAHKGRVRA